MQDCVTGIRLARVGDIRVGRRREIRVSYRRRLHFVCKWVPIDSRIVDDNRRNCLGDDSFHDLLNHALPGETVLFGGIIGFDLVAKVPVAQQSQLRGKESLAILIDQVMHPDVVIGDIARGSRLGLANGQIHIRGNALGKSLSEP